MQLVVGSRSERLDGFVDVPACEQQTSVRVAGELLDQCLAHALKDVVALLPAGEVCDLMQPGARRYAWR